MSCKRGDEIIVGPPIGNGLHACVRHTADHKVQTATARVLREGENINGSHVVWGRVGENRTLHVEHEMDLRQGQAQSAGPACVATDAYRDGWDRIFGKRSAAGEA